MSRQHLPFCAQYCNLNIVPTSYQRRYTYVGPSTGSHLQVALNVVCDKVIKGLALLHALVQRAARCSNAVLYDALGQDVEEWAQHLQHRAAVGASVGTDTTRKGICTTLNTIVKC